MGEDLWRSVSTVDGQVVTNAQNQKGKDRANLRLLQSMWPHWAPLFGAAPKCWLYFRIYCKYIIIQFHPLLYLHCHFKSMHRQVSQIYFCMGFRNVLIQPWVKRLNLWHWRKRWQRVSFSKQITILRRRYCEIHFLPHLRPWHNLPHFLSIPFNTWHFLAPL